MQQTPRTNPATKSRPHYEDVIVKDFSNEPFFDDDGQDFEVKTIKEERLIDPLPELDDTITFRENMYNFGDEKTFRQRSRNRMPHSGNFPQQMFQPLKKSPVCNRQGKYFNW